MLDLSLAMTATTLGLCRKFRAQSDRWGWRPPHFWKLELSGWRNWCHYSTASSRLHRIGL